MAKTVLVINSGSSSIKYQLVNLESGEALASGLVEKIGEPTDGAYTHKFDGEKHTFTEPIKDHEQGLKKVLAFFDEYGPNLKDYELVAVGHRVVQGGYIFPTPALVTPQTIQQVKDLAVLAPLHNGPEAIGAEVMTRLLPDVPQGFVFDTAPVTSMWARSCPKSSASRPKASSRSSCTSATVLPLQPRFPASRWRPPWA